MRDLVRLKPDTTVCRYRFFVATTPVRRFGAGNCARKRLVRFDMAFSHSS